MHSRLLFSVPVMEFFKSRFFKQPRLDMQGGTTTHPVLENAPQTPTNQFSLLPGATPQRRSPSVNAIATVQKADNRSGRSCLPREVEEILSRQGAAPTQLEQIAQLTREIEGLNEYKKLVTTALANNEEPDGTSMNPSDIRYAPHIVAMKNAKNKDLHLLYFRDPDDLAAIIEKNCKISKTEHGSEIRFIALVNIKGERRAASTKPTNDHSEPHHVIIDVCIKNGKASLIALDPISLVNDIPKYAALNLENSITRYKLNAVFSYICVGTQQSRADCPVFCMTFADKIYAKRARFNEIHEKQRKAPDRKDKIKDIFGYNIMPFSDTLLKTWNDVGEIQRHEHAVYVTPDGRHFLDIEFYKHINSRRRFQELINGRPEATSQPVNGKGQTLEARVSEHFLEIPRIISRFDEKKGEWISLSSTASNSIEKKRLLYVEKAITFFEGLKHMLEEEVKEAKGATEASDKKM